MHFHAPSPWTFNGALCEMKSTSGHLSQTRQVVHAQRSQADVFRLLNGSLQHFELGFVVTWDNMKEFSKSG